MQHSLKSMIFCKPKSHAPQGYLHVVESDIVKRVKMNSGYAARARH
jgi:hypothetical protein